MGTGGYQIVHKSATQLANELYALGDFLSRWEYTQIRDAIEQAMPDENGQALRDRFLDIVIDGVSMTGLDIVKIANKVMKIESIYAKAEQEGAAGSMLA